MIIMILIFVVGLIMLIMIKGCIFKVNNSLLFLFNNNEEGEVKAFQALMNSLAASLGIGNLIGVTQAILIGGPGSIFWMWISSIFGMAIKYAEGYLTIKYREEKKEYQSGPMYYIKNGMPSKYRFLAYGFCFFGICASFGVGNMIQANSMAKATNNPFLLGFVLSIMVYLTIIGGIKNISKITEKIIPFITLLFTFVSLIGIIRYINEMPMVFELILNDAFSGRAVAGGSLYICIKYGLSRGIISNEAGMGTSAIAHGASKNSNPHEVGMIASLEPLIDTIILCSLTAFIVLVTNIENHNFIYLGHDAYNLVKVSYEKVLGIYGEITIFLSIMILGFATIIGWYYYGEKCYLFLFKDKAKYQYIYVLVVFLGAIINANFVWEFSILCNNLMALPNIIAIIYLSKQIVKRE